jgi:hypothetical protein
MNFLCQGGTVKSINDGQEHYINPREVKDCFSEALENFKGNSHTLCEGYGTFYHKDFRPIILKPRSDGNYSMVDEIFQQFKPKEKWASVAITGKDGKPFYIKDKELVNEIIMRCDSAVAGIHGNNRLFNKLIDEVVQRPEPKPEESSEAWEKRYEKWRKFWGAKPVVLDCEVFDVQLLSSCSMNGPLSFVNPESGKVGLVTNCRWTWEPIEACREELQWICDEICDEDNKLEFYVSFFDEDYNYGKYGKLPDYDSEKMRMKKVEYNDPQVTFKLSHKGIELVPIIPVKKMKWAFKCNRKLYGKEYKRWSLVWPVEKLFRNLQEKFFYNDWVAWHDYTMWGGLDSIYTKCERHFTMDQTIRMLQMWQDFCCEWQKENEDEQD